MMKLIFTLSVLVGSVAFAHEHTPNVCVQGVQQKVCAHLGFEEKMNSSQEGKFKAHFMTAKGTEIQDLKIDLWMDMGPGHGHGSAPVTIAPAGKNMFNVTNAWFVMMGEWQVRMNFTLDGQAEQIIIPIQINE